MCECHNTIQACMKTRNGASGGQAKTACGALLITVLSCAFIRRDVKFIESVMH